MRNIGIYAGTFDPVHAGHVAFATAALTHCGLDAVYLVPERTPRHKANATAYDTRIAALRARLADTLIDILEFPDESLTVSRTLPEIQHRFPDARISILVGSDVITHMPTWPHLAELIDSCDFIVGMREGHTRQDIAALLTDVGIATPWILETKFSHLSSSQLRNQ